MDECISACRISQDEFRWKIACEPGSPGVGGNLDDTSSGMKVGIASNSLEATAMEENLPIEVAR
jgi:hypothetical protein